VIIRIMGEGQLKLEDAAVDELNKLDADLEKAVESSDQAAFGSALLALLVRAREVGVELPPDAIEPSDLILPREDATIEEVRELMTDDGLIPG
jgi:PspA-Associated protein